MIYYTINITNNNAVVNFAYIYSIPVPNGAALEESENMWWIWLLAILSSAGGVCIYKYVDNNRRKGNLNNNK